MRGWASMATEALRHLSGISSSLVLISEQQNTIIELLGQLRDAERTTNHTLMTTIIAKEASDA